MRVPQTIMISFSSGLVTMWCFGKFLFKSDFLCGFSTTEKKKRFTKLHNVLILPLLLKATE